MTTIICLIGASGSGKTTIAKELGKMGCNVIQSYTTRPPRHKDEWGHTFIGKYTVHKVPRTDRVIINDITHTTLHRDSDMIAYFNSYNSGHHYFATDKQVIRGKTNVYIVNPKGAEMVHDFYEGTDVEVLTIYLQVDREIRRKRMTNRCFNKLINEFEEVYERLSKDDKLFQTVKCDYAVDANPELNTVLANIEKIIEAING